MGDNNKVELGQLLNQQYLCESLTIKEVQTLLDFTDPIAAKNHEVVAEIGEVGDGLFFVTQGEVGLFRDDQNKEVEVARVKAGELMGEMSFFDRQPRSVRIRSLSDETHLLKLSRAMYKRLRVEHPYIAVNVVEHAIVSLDHLFRQVSRDVTTFTNYFYGAGRK